MSNCPIMSKGRLSISRLEAYVAYSKLLIVISMLPIIFVSKAIRKFLYDSNHSPLPQSLKSLPVSSYSLPPLRLKSKLGTLKFVELQSCFKNLHTHIVISKTRVLVLVEI